jgi:predicted nucleic acid-binding protein
VTVVADASVALKWFVAEEGTSDATALLLNAGILIAPELVIAEVCNALWKTVRRGNLRIAQFEEAAHELPKIFDELVPLSGLCAQACKIASVPDHPVYDTFYLALAELRDAELITADKRLSMRVQGSKWAPRVRLLGE